MRKGGIIIGNETVYLRKFRVCKLQKERKQETMNNFTNENFQRFPYECLSISAKVGKMEIIIFGKYNLFV